MKAKLKEIYSLDTQIPLCEYIPENLTFFSLSIRLMIGLEFSLGAEAFDVEVCTSDWLEKRCELEGPVWGSQTLIVSKYDFEIIKNEIERYIENCTGNNWEEIARKLGKIGVWEFEGYR